MGDDKLIIRIPKPQKNESNWSGMIRVSADNHAVLMDLKKQTGLSVDKLLGMILDFAIEKIEIVEE